MFSKVSTIFVLLSFVATAHSSCHTCQANLAMCHDERRFTMCSEGISPSEMFECPIGYVCTGEDEICVRASAVNTEPTCDSSCDLCKSQGNLFACLDATTYAYCFGANVPDYGTIGTCPDGYVCNLNSPQVCTPAAGGYASCYSGSPGLPSTSAPNTVSTSDSSSPTPSQTTSSAAESPATPPVTASPIPTQSEPSSTPEQPRDAVTFCKGEQKTGYYRAVGDRTCQEYFYCYLLSGQYLGVKYICPTSKFFDDATGRCEKKKPANC